MSTSPDDGSASSLLAINAFARKALENNARFHFNEQIDTLLVEKGRVVGVAGGHGHFFAGPAVLRSSRRTKIA